MRPSKRTGNRLSERPPHRTEDVRGALAVGISNCRDLGSVRRSLASCQASGINRIFLAEDVGCRDAFELAAAVTASLPDQEDPLTGSLQSPTLTISVTNPYLRSPGALAACA